MESLREVRCMESVPKARHGIMRRRASFLRIDYIHHFVMIPSKAYALIPYRRQAADYIHGSAVIYHDRTNGLTIS